MPRRPIPGLVLLLVLAACGDEPAPAPAPGGALRRAPSFVPVPALPWAQVSQAQIDGAARMGVPVAFENRWGMRFVFVPAGIFQMGSPAGEAGRREDEAQHEVHIGMPFFMQVGRVEERHRRALDAGAAASRIAHGEAEAFARRLSGEDDTWDYRLPTEAEWEYACRAGSGSAYPWGDVAPPDPDAFRANAWGLRDMLTGPGEWCLDHHGPYPTWAVTDPHGPTDGAAYVVRGAGGDGPARCAARSSASAGEAGVRLIVPVGYGLGKYGSIPVTFRLLDPSKKEAPVADAGQYDLRIIRMNDRLAARTQGTDTVWERVKTPGSPVTLTMVPGKYYVYAERIVDGALARGIEIKFHVWEHAIEVPVPVPAADMKRFGSGGREKPQ